MPPKLAVKLLGYLFVLSGLLLMGMMLVQLHKHPPLGSPASYPKTFPQLKNMILRDFSGRPGLEDLDTHPDPYGRLRQYLIRGATNGALFTPLGIGLLSRKQWGWYLALGTLLFLFIGGVWEVVVLHAHGIPWPPLLAHRFGLLIGSPFLVFWLFHTSTRPLFWETK